MNKLAVLDRANASSKSLAVGGSVLQRKCGCGQHTHGSGPCAACRKNRQGTHLPTEDSAHAATVPRNVGERTWRNSNHTRDSAASWIPTNPTTYGLTVVAELLRGRDNGVPVDSMQRRNVEARLGTSLEHIRVHTGKASAAASALIGAHAFTVGKDIYLGKSSLTESSAKEAVVNHELFHTAQQREWNGEPLELLPRNSVQERAAENFGRVRGHRPADVAESLSPQRAKVMTLSAAGAALIAGELACLFGFYVYALTKLWHKGDKFLHCWTSCKIATWCPPIPLVSQTIAILIGALKELADIVIGESEIRDMQNNMSGVECSLHYLTSCDDCCNDKLSRGVLASDSSPEERELLATGEATRSTGERDESFTGSSAIDFARERIPETVS